MTTEQRVLFREESEHVKAFLTMIDEWIPDEAANVSGANISDNVRSHGCGRLEMLMDVRQAIETLCTSNSKLNH